MPLRAEKLFHRLTVESPRSVCEASRYGGQALIRRLVRFLPDWAIHYGVIRSWALKIFPIDLPWRKCCLGNIVFILDRIFFEHADNKDRHKTFEEFTFWPDQTIWFRVSCTCPWASENFPIDLQRGRCCGHNIFDRIIIKLTGNQDRHKILYEFKFQPHLIFSFGVTCWKVFP